MSLFVPLDYEQGCVGRDVTSFLLEWLVPNLTRTLLVRLWDVMCNVSLCTSAADSNIGCRHSTNSVDVSCGSFHADVQ